MKEQNIIQQQNVIQEENIIQEEQNICKKIFCNCVKNKFFKSITIENKSNKNIKNNNLKIIMTPSYLNNHN
tara:strand:- start:14 stop:226 length:213 start_codon:yes stop_codon:yes gene_type:complete